MELVFVWLLITFAVATFSVLIGKKYGVIYPTTIFATLVVLANILAVKLVVIGDYVVPAGTLVFITTYLITDLVSEIWGKKEARNAVWAGFYANIIAVIAILIAIAWPPAPFAVELSDMFSQVLGSAWRIVVASMIAYLISMHLDVTFFHWIKDWTEGRHLWLRNNLATIPANFLGAAVFAFIAFWGVVPNIWTFILTLAIIQSVMVLIDTPFAYVIRSLSKKIK
ncbi:transporter [bacterium]|nr:transporter [bacterium]|tara:strand:- start:12467 stop:13141 length:675 start_codon:yes stop_codon:yes gene_type:complete